MDGILSSSWRILLGIKMGAFAMMRSALFWRSCSLFMLFVASTKIKSEARELVESFPITNENYPLAIESLTERYGRKELLIDFYVRELLKLVLNNATKKKQDSLSGLYNKLSTQLRALSSLGVTTDQCGVILYPLVESSLPTHILQSFERQRKNIDSEQSISTLDAIVSFLKSEVQSEEKIKLSRSEILPYERECKHLAKRQNTLPAAAELFIQESKDTCAFCFKVHANRFCKRAFFIPLEEKIAIIKKKGLCRVCLAKGHLDSRCRSQITCELCSKRHLKFMCPNIVCNKSDSPKQELARRFSRFSKMVRVMTWVLRFQPKAKDFRQYTELTNEELLNAQKIIFRVVQKECYSNEETRKNLRGLQVFEDEEGILRLKSRLINEEESKYFISPIILPSKHLAMIKKRQHWLLGRVLELFPGKDGIIRLVKLRTEKGNVLRPIQRLYPLELKPNYEQVVSENQKGPEVVTEYPELNTDSNKTVPVTSSGREIKPVKRLDS
ncbi:transposon Tf2-6 polyprotein [Nephila pilipes]|uniref:Transposon Tf2-6 polyprotein n=1 Tax=Nephila pilipes TaxID=299642 RepID=A0A8X6QU92_NEPPI|nr:transposon Tf2-6 polyprotein [Nephila pilipes]